MKGKNGILMSNFCLNAILIVLLLSMPAFADTETTEDVTEKDAGATHLCGRNNAACTYDPRSDINSDGGTDDDIVYWDQHGESWNITNDISTFMTEEQMLQGFTLDSSVGLRDRNYVGGDAFSIKIKVTDGTTTYTDTQNFTTSAGQAYETITSQLIVPENTLAYSLATFGLILEGTSLTGGYRGPQTNQIGLTATYELINNAEQTVLDIVSNAVNDILDSAMAPSSMDIGVSSPSGTTNLNIPITVTPTTVTLAVPTVSGGVQKIEIKTGMSTSDSPQQVEQVAEVVAEVESKMEEDEASGEEGKSSKTQDKSKAVQAIVTRVLQAVAIAGGDTDTTKLALMGILNNQGFKQYQQASIPDSLMYVSDIPYQSQIIDPLSSVYALGSDKTMDEMIMQQYDQR